MAKGDTVIADGIEYVVTSDFAVHKCTRVVSDEDRWAELVSRADRTNNGMQGAPEPSSRRYLNPKGSPSHRGPRDA